MRALGLVVALACAACATPATRDPRLVDDVAPAALAAWADLSSGRASARTVRFAPETDALALFGQGSAAFERGLLNDAHAAFERTLALAAEGRGGSFAPLVAAAAAVRLLETIELIDDRASAEARLLALPRDRLPWQAALALARIGDEAARRTGDERRLATLARAAGCPDSVSFRGRVGRLPLLDLESAAKPASAPVTLRGSGCRISLPARAGTDGLPGVVELALTWPSDARGEHEVVLDHGGLAALAPEGSSWMRHGSLDRYGPRISAHRVDAGKRVLVRLGTFGGGTELTVLVRPVGAPRLASLDAPEAPEPARVAYFVASGLVAAFVGDGDALAEATAVLAGQRKFGVGLAVAAELTLADPSRPPHLARDAARGLYRRATDADPSLARPHRELASLELADERPREAIAEAEEAVRLAPAWWNARALLATALEAHGLELDADAALDRAVGKGPAPCGLVPALAARAVRRRDDAAEATFAEALYRCDVRSGSWPSRLRNQGKLAEAERAMRAGLRTSPDPTWGEIDLAALQLAGGRAREAVATLRAALARAPRDASLPPRLADALLAAGDREAARIELARAVARFPGSAEVRQAARAFGVALPIEALRIDGREVIRAFEASQRRYDAPAVLVLDRTVERVFPDGGRLVLTHNIVRVQAKDAIDRWGEVAVPAGAEVLTLRTVKANGRMREPEDIVGKETISAPDLEPGDYVESETVEYEEPSPAFAPGFLSNRFYFQSVDLPLDRSEYLVVVPKDTKVSIDARASAPSAVRSDGPDGTVAWFFATRGSGQVFAERAAVPPVEWLPSVRVSSGLSVEGWSRFIADRVAGLPRANRALDEVASRLRREAGSDPWALAAALVRWVTNEIEAEQAADEPATWALARGRGNRFALTLALARRLGLAVEPVLVRPRTVAEGAAAAKAEQLDDFSELLLHFPDLAGKDAFVDVRLRHAPFGYVAPAQVGAAALVVGSGRIVRPRSTVEDKRTVELSAQLGADGEAEVDVTERLTGWPALEWAELLDRTGDDRTKLNQAFEESWLGQHFPGSVLKRLEVKPQDGADRPVLLRYAFSSPRLGARQGRDVAVSPSFFRAQPGRRYAAEAQRRTPLLLGYDVAMDLRATFRLPAGAELVDAGRSATIEVGGVTGSGRFVETRKELTRGQVTLHRSWALPLSRVTPDRYGEVAARLRQIDPIELGEIRVRTP